MCLTINSTRLKAETDILCYKCLDKNEDGEYCTPFTYFPIEFVGGICEMKSRLYRDKKCVNVGIHSYALIDKAEELKEDFYDKDGTDIYDAIIPKGAYYYIGKEDDIASNKLIIFETSEDFEKYVTYGNEYKLAEKIVNEFGIEKQIRTY